MKMTDIKREFKRDNAEWIKKHWDDPIMINLEFTYHIDHLNKAGLITNYQAFRAGNLVKRENGKTRFCR